MRSSSRRSATPASCSRADVTPAPALLVHAGAASEDWRRRFQARCPTLPVVTLADGHDPAQVAWFAGWNPPPGVFARMTALRALFALGAGVDALLARDDLPPTVPVARLLDAGMADQMAEYALLGVLHWQRYLFDYAVQQQACEWRQLPPRGRGDVRVGVLGLGRMGAVVASTLGGLGYRVTGWSRRAQVLAGVTCVAGPGALDALLATSDVLVSVLPSTPRTRGLLDRRRLSQLPDGAVLVQASRGDQLDLHALQEQLDGGRLAGALLDVFPVEPLPADHPLWRHPRVRITPHVAAITLPEPALDQITANMARLQRGEPMHGVVDRGQSY